MKFIYFKDSYAMNHPVGENIENALEYISLVAPHVQNVIKKSNLNIWCQGSSGAILSAFLVKELDNSCKICHIKKEGEWSHQNYVSEIFYAPCKNILIDDFMRSGNTLDRIYEAYSKKFRTYLDILILSNGYNDVIPKFKPKCIIIDKATGKEWEKLFKQKT